MPTCLHFTVRKVIESVIERRHGFTEVDVVGGLLEVHDGADLTVVLNLRKNQVLRQE